MNDHIKITTNEDIDIKALLQLFRKRIKFILLTPIIFLVAGVLYGLFAPKEYESKSIISIGKIASLLIDTPTDLENALNLITVPGYTDYNSTGELVYNNNTATNLQITAISNSPNAAYELNQAILDTILNRHSKIINRSKRPLELAINTLGDYMDDLTAEFNNGNNILDKYITSLALLNKSKSELIKELNKISNSKVIIVPKIPKFHTRPNLRFIVVLTFLFGLIAGPILVVLMNSYNN